MSLLSRTLFILHKKRFSTKLEKRTRNNMHVHYKHGSTRINKWIKKQSHGNAVLNGLHNYVQTAKGTRRTSIISPSTSDFD